MGFAYPVVIVGAGIGGLTTAACLSKAGIPSLLLEKTGFVGGRCSTRDIGGKHYEIGALYVGGGLFDSLRKDLGIECRPISITWSIKLGSRLVTISGGLRTALQLKFCGVRWIDLFFFMCRSRFLDRLLVIGKNKSLGDVFDFLTNDPTLRKFLDAGAGVSGVSPYRLPGSYAFKDSPTSKYRSFEPEYLHEGNGKIASLLLESAKPTCEVVFNSRVNRILVNNGAVVGVETDQGHYECQAVISNAGLKQTVLDLTAPGDWPSIYYQETRRFPETLQIVNVFLTFSRSFSFPEGVAIFLVPGRTEEEFALLESGRFPEDSMYILHVPSNIEPHSGQPHRATLQFYHPRGEVTRDTLDNQVERILNQGLERLFPGLSAAVTDFLVYDPIRYEREFGFPPFVFGISPDFEHKRFPVETPIRNLFCVGDSVGPGGPSVPQAFESGVQCAGMVAGLSSVRRR